MDLRENFALSLTGLLTHKLRSVLTMLGIIFGVAAVIAMLSIGAGAQREALEQIRLLGLSNIILQSEPIIAEDDERGEVVEGPGLTLQDARSLMRLAPLVDAAVPQTILPGQRVMRGREIMTTTVVGTTPPYPELLDLPIAAGGFFSFRDVHEMRRVCVLGHGVKRRLFLFGDAVGALIKIGDDWYTVAGVMAPIPASTGRGGAGDRDMNQDVYIPLSSAQGRFDHDPQSAPIDQIILSATETDRIREIASLAHELVRLRHNAMEDFRIVIPEALLRQSQRTQRVFNIVMGAIAGISLLVGGIGIMNIMLASILERTREIGIRRAVGATRRDILGQFLIESIFLSVSGGAIGVLLGFLMTQGIATYAHWQTIVEFTAILLAVGVSVSVGLIFGIYPARQAARMDPIESLRHE